MAEEESTTGASHANDHGTHGKDVAHQHGHHHHHHHHHPHGDHDHRDHHHGDHHHDFSDPHRWIDLFEEEVRATEQAPEACIDLLKLSASDKVLDLGSGTGYMIPLLASRVPQGCVVSADVAESLVTFQRERFTELTNVTYVVTPSEQCVLDGVDDPVTGVITCNTLHHFPVNLSAYFDSIAAVCAPGARLVVVDWTVGDFPKGPPADMKLSAEEAVAVVTQSGQWQLERVAEELNMPMHYAIVFTRNS